MKKTFATFLALTLGLFASTAHAGTIGHYAGGMYNIRDFQMPAAPGFYAALYNYYYQTGRVNDRNGDEVSSVTIGKNPPLQLNVNVSPDVDIYYMVPAFIWITPWKFLGADVGVMVVPTFANASVGASFDTVNGRGANPNDSQFGIGDWYFQPLWLGWHLEHFDFSVNYAFYAPTGKYDTSVKTFPIAGDIRVSKPDNIGLGFWTNQFQGAATWYPWVNKATAVMLASTYEINSKKEDFHLTPGQNLSLNWGVSQYLPLSKDEKWLAELGVCGYDTWQVTNDSGKDKANATRDQVHAAGGQVGVTSVEYEGVLNFHYYREYESQGRFQGNVFMLSLSKHF